jgi:GMP synthase (glutamine-hydrolysing)
MRTILALRHVPHESLGRLEPIFLEAGLDFRYCDLFDGRVPDIDTRMPAGLVVLGGPMNVDEVDKYPFLARECEWLRTAVAADTPVLGICLGSQLLAKALGARVYPNPVKEIGWYDVGLTAAAESDPLFTGLQPVERVFQWHGDTFDLPPGAVHLATSDLCRHQAFRHGEAAWGLQFHWEVTPGMVEDWLQEPSNRCELAGLDYIDTAAIRAAMDDEWPRLRRPAQTVLGRFAALCCGRA